jgi:hypothetical protein
VTTEFVDIILYVIGKTDVHPVINTVAFIIRLISNKITFSFNNEGDYFLFPIECMTLRFSEYVILFPLPSILPERN